MSYCISDPWIELRKGATSEMESTASPILDYADTRFPSISFIPYNVLFSFSSSSGSSESLLLDNLCFFSLLSIWFDILIMGEIDRETTEAALRPRSLVVYLLRFEGIFTSRFFRLRSKSNSLSYTTTKSSLSVSTVTEPAFRVRLLASSSPEVNLCFSFLLPRVKPFGSKAYWVFCLVNLSL